MNIFSFYCGTCVLKYRNTSFRVLLTFSKVSTLRSLKIFLILSACINEISYVIINHQKTLALFNISRYLRKIDKCIQKSSVVTDFSSR